MAGMITLRVARLKKKWTQTQLARESGVSQNHISRLERPKESGGCSEPGYTIVRSLEKALGLKPGELKV